MRRKDQKDKAQLEEGFQRNVHRIVIDVKNEQ